MELMPVGKELEDNAEFAKNPLLLESLLMSINFYKRVGYVLPWIGYYVKIDGDLVGAAGFKGPPVNGAIEIAYGTFEPYRQKGIGTRICKQLVDLSLKTDPAVRITARTLPENNFSTSILKKNNFRLLGTVNDPEDGWVWEWELGIGH